jgi:hypothetical protein
MKYCGWGGDGGCEAEWIVESGSSRGWVFTCTDRDGGTGEGAALLDGLIGSLISAMGVLMGQV